jgi:cell division protein FtsW (lipid II flippase)
MPAKKSKRTISPESRSYGLVLLILLFGWLAIMATRWANAPVLRWPDFSPLVWLAFCLLATRVLLRAMDFRGDQLLPPLVMLLYGCGLLVQFRLGNLALDDWTRPAAGIYPLGWLAFAGVWLFMRRGRYAVLAGSAIPALMLALGVLGIILIFGQRFRGAMFLAGQVNPAEVVKLLLAIFMAGVLADFKKPLQQTVAGIPAPPLKSILTIGVLWALPMLLLIAQRDLGMFMLLNVVFLLLLFMSTGKWGYLWVGGGLAAAAGYAGFTWFAHAGRRLAVWLDPFADPTGAGWQILQALSAMFTGGLWGAGFGGGVPTVIPVASSDFVYALWAEELGFVGCVLLLSVYALLFYRGFAVADGLKQPFAQTLAAALVMLLAVQTIINIGGVIKALPLTGITLPLISQGGSSLVTTMAMLGLLLALSEPSGKKR